MNLPSMVSKAKIRDNQTAFYGYNHNLINSANEFYDMKNMTGDCCPIMSPRKRRGRINVKLRKPQGLIAKDSLAWIDNNDFYYAGKFKGSLPETNADRQMISMGAYIIIWPDKFRYNTATDKFEALEHSFKATGTVKIQLCKIDGTPIDTGEREITEKPEEPQNGDWWIDSSGGTAVLKVYSEATDEWGSVATTYAKISAAGISAGFELYDAVEINDVLSVYGIEAGSYPIWDKGKNDEYIVITALVSGVYEFESDTHQILTVERKVPDLDYIVESENRLWGCRWDGDINEIRACAQGDAKNWNKYLGTTQDSYALSVGSDGVFTGAAVQQGYVMFFKENVIHKIYGSKPSNYQITNVTGRGIMRGCSKSACIVNETLYYLSKNGVCQYGGGTPAGIYAPFGDVKYSDAAGGKCTDKYYISMKDKKGKYSLFVFDENLNMWFKEDDTHARFFAEDKGVLYFINDKNELWVTDAENYDGEFEIAETEKPFEWFAETGDIGIQEPDCKWYSDIQIRLSMETGTQVDVFVQYNSDGEWHQVESLKNKPKGAYTINFNTPKVDHFKIKIKGKGDAKIYSISKYYEEGSGVRGNGY